MTKKEMKSLIKHLKSEIEKVSNFFLQEAPERIDEGSACDNAVRHMRRFTIEKNEIVTRS